MDQKGEHDFLNLLGFEEREWSKREDHSTAGSMRPLPAIDVKSQVSEISPGIIKSYHLSMLFSLVDGFSEEAVDNAESALANNLRNLRDLDIGAFNEATEFVGRGATFNVQRTTFPDSSNVVLKSPVLVSDRDARKSLMEKLEATLLELRVLTHPPLRHHKNIAQLIQVGWQGDPQDASLKWPVLIIDYADRGTLRDLFENTTTLDFSSKLSLFRDVAEGLQALHSCGVAHGDIKLQNVLVYSNPQRGFTAKLSDFGGALLDNPAGFQEPMGTPPWTAPEYKTERPRDHLLLSDIYALGLLFWRIILDGQDPFLDPLFNLPADQTKADELKFEMKKSDDFINQVMQTLISHQKFSDLQLDLLGAVLNNTVRLNLLDRSLSKVLSALRTHFETQSVDLVSDPTIDVLTSPKAEEKEVEVHQEEAEVDSEIRLSLGGLSFEGPTRAFSGHVLAALEHTARYDLDTERRIEAASILARMYLAPDDFGIDQNVDKGLFFLAKSAEAGEQEDQALLPRLYSAFGQEVPQHLQPLLGQWLAAAASTGSLTAMEDLAWYGLELESKEAKTQLRTRYCGFGEEVFEFEGEVLNAFQDPFDESGRSYLNVELETGRNKDQDLRGYFLRLSAAYGGVGAVNYLVEELGADIHDCNSFGDRALLLAARSGHKDLLIVLLGLGADPRLCDQGDDTSLHWLCSFDDGDVEEVAENLVRHGADINAQANEFPVQGRLQYAETEFVAGTPLHRAICRGKLQAVRTLIRLGAKLDSPALQGIDDTPLALATLLHYPDILAECLSNYHSSESAVQLVTPGGRSLLIPAIQGGSLHRMTIGRLIRHGDQWKKRASDTLALLCEYGATAHFDNLPGQPGCTALFFAARYQPHVLEYLICNGSRRHVDIRSKRFENDDEFDLDLTMRRPPLQEAILWAKPLNALKLLELGADATLGDSEDLPTSALYQCVVASLEDLTLAEELCQRGLGVDDGPSDYETPFMFAVRNGCFKLADFLRSHGANVNALRSRGYMWSSVIRRTILLVLLRNNRAPSLSGLSFLLNPKSCATGTPIVNVVVEPELNHTAFHAIAMLKGDSLDSDTATKALDICDEYFKPSTVTLNMKSHPRLHPHASPSDTDVKSVVDQGGNTALHYAAIFANFEAVSYLLRNGADPTITNTMGMTALDIASLSYPDFETRFVPTDVPKSRERQLETARYRRNEIMRRLFESTPNGVNMSILEKFTL